MVEPMKKPYMKESGPDLHALQAEVGGNIATSYPFDDLMGQVLNDEGKLISLDLNRSLQDKYGEIYDIVAVTTGGRQTGVWVAKSPRQARPAEEAAGVGHLISRSKKMTSGMDVLPGRERQTPVYAFCGAQRTPMRFRADAVRSITDALKRHYSQLVSGLDHYGIVFCCPFQYRIG